jgi:hypothetical protein
MHDFLLFNKTVNRVFTVFFIYRVITFFYILPTTFQLVMCERNYTTLTLGLWYTGDTSLLPDT